MIREDPAVRRSVAGAPKHRQRFLSPTCRNAGPQQWGTKGKNPKHSRRWPKGPLRPVNRFPPPSASILFGVMPAVTYLVTFLLCLTPRTRLLALARSCCFPRPPAPPCPPRSSGALVSPFGSRGSHRVSLVVATLLAGSSGVRSLRVAATALQGRRRSTLAERTSTMPT